MASLSWRSKALTVAEFGGCLIGGHGSAEQEPLGEVASARPEGFELLDGLDAFTDDGEIERASKHHNRDAEGRVAAHQTSNNRLIDGTRG
jgi:hypothetical protein